MCGVTFFEIDAALAIIGVPTANGAPSETLDLPRIVVFTAVPMAGMVVAFDASAS